VKGITFLGSSKRDLSDFPQSAKRAAGFQLRRIQAGEAPDDFKPMPTIGAGVEELRIWVEEGTFRVVYYTRLADTVYVLHAFQKKTQETAQRDLALARRRYLALAGEKGDR
jgi:phage-related protein